MSYDPKDIRKKRSLRVKSKFCFSHFSSKATNSDALALVELSSLYIAHMASGSGTDGGRGIRRD